MQTTIGQRIHFLKESALFRELPDEDLADLSARLHDYHLAAGGLLYAAGDRAENLYLLYGGRMSSAGPEGIASVIEAGDVFGERTLLEGTPRQFTVSAASDCHLLYLPRPDLAWLLERHPAIEDALHHLSAGASLRGEVDFDWLRPDEQMHFVSRKHPSALWFRLARAMVVAILAVSALLAGMGNPDPASQWNWFAGGGALLLLAAGVTVWEYLDWRNDYYVLTNLRVVWVEQVLLRSSSRKEAPLESIQSIDGHTSLLGRWLGFGDVIVRTYTGTVLMPTVPEPHNTKQLIEEYVARHRRQQREEEHDSIRQAVRASLGHADDAPAEAVAAPASMVEHPEPFRFFRTRTVEPDGITYHKHWFVLFGRLLQPAFFFVAVIFVLRALYGGLPSGGANWLLALAFTALPLAVFVYRFVDWQNDIYRVTDTSLIDTEKKPLGSEVTKSASVANVLSLENHKVGILGILLNFGVVRINVGDTHLEFADVSNPVQVQQDIFLRMQAFKQRSEAAEEAEDRQRMTEWLRVYNEERQRDAG